MRRYLVLVAITVLGLVAAYSYHHHLAGATDVRSTSASPVAAVVGGASPSTQSGGAHVSPFGSGVPAVNETKDAPGPISAGLLRNFNSDRSTKERVTFAKRHVREGGTFYAARMLAQCNTVRGTPSFEEGSGVFEKGDPHHARRVESANLLRQQCSDMTASETSDDQMEALVQLGRREDDPLFAAAEKLRLVPNRYRDDEQTMAVRKAATAALLSTQDPLLIEDAGMGLLLYVDAKTSKKYFWFDGQSYGLDSDYEVGAALYLLPCGLGLRCDSHDYKIALSCASGEVCDSNRFEQLRRMFASRPGVLENVEQLYKRMLVAVQSGNTAAFSR